MTATKTENDRDNLRIAEGQNCPKCGCGAVLINEDGRYECGFCGTCWNKDEVRSIK